MAPAGSTPVKHVEKARESHKEEEIKKVSDRIKSIESECEKDGFDSHVTEDIGGILTIGTCVHSGIDIDAERLGLSMLDADKRALELDMANRIYSKSNYLERAAEEVLGPLMKDSKKTSALAYWTTISRRLESKKVGDAERKWLESEENNQDSILMKGAGVGFKNILSLESRKKYLTLFSRIRRAGNSIPSLRKLFKLP